MPVHIAREMLVGVQVCRVLGKPQTMGTAAHAADGGSKRRKEGDTSVKIYRVNMSGNIYSAGAEFYWGCYIDCRERAGRAMAFPSSSLPLHLLQAAQELVPRPAGLRPTEGLVPREVHHHWRPPAQRAVAHQAV